MTYRQGDLPSLGAQCKLPATLHSLYMLYTVACLLHVMNANGRKENAVSNWHGNKI